MIPNMIEVQSTKVPTLKNLQYEIERDLLTKRTYCTLKVDLSHIFKILNKGCYISVKTKNSVAIAYAPTKAARIFTKCLAHLGCTLENPSIIYVCHITLHEGDVDDEKVARRIVRDKAHNTVCKIVNNALVQAMRPINKQLNKLTDIHYCLYTQSKY